MKHCKSHAIAPNSTRMNTTMKDKSEHNPQILTHKFYTNLFCLNSCKFEIPTNGPSIALSPDMNRNGRGIYKAHGKYDFKYCCHYVNINYVFDNGLKN